MSDLKLSLNASIDNDGSPKHVKTRPRLPSQSAKRKLQSSDRSEVEKASVQLESNPLSSTSPSTSLSRASVSPSSDEIDRRPFTPTNHGQEGGTESSLSARLHQAASSDRIFAIDDIVRSHHRKTLRQPNFSTSTPVPAIPQHLRNSIQRIPSIDEIIKQHSPSLKVPLGKTRAISLPPESQALERSRTISQSSDLSGSRSSLDSIAVEVARSNKRLDGVARLLQPSQSLPSFPPSSTSHRQRHPSATSQVSQTPSRTSSSNDRSVRSTTPNQYDDNKNAINTYLQSPRLTRILTLKRPPNQHVTVSLSDLGDVDGFPVLVFLGLGVVRYIMAVHDDLARTYGLRMICIDRWGLGRTTEIPESRRGLMEWASVVEEVLDQLGIDRFSALAHSAGAPYALASCVRLQDRVHGSLHLLAPWVNGFLAEPALEYRWLKYVPTPVLKTALAAEWKVNAWKFGKSPKVNIPGVGFNPHAPVASGALSPVLQQYDSKEYEESKSAKSAPPLVMSRTAVLLAQPTFSPSKPLGARPQIRHPYPHLSHDTPTRDQTPIRTDKQSLDTDRASLSPSNPIPIMGDNPTKSVSCLPGFSAALYRASLSECSRGAAADLTAILLRTSKSPGITYADLQRHIKIWHGSKDDKISLSSVLPLEASLDWCTVKVADGADHSLLTNFPVMVDCFSSIANEVPSPAQLIR